MVYYPHPSEPFNIILLVQFAPPKSHALDAYAVEDSHAAATAVNLLPTLQALHLPKFNPARICLSGRVSGAFELRWMDVPGRDRVHRRFESVVKGEVTGEMLTELGLAQLYAFYLPARQGGLPPFWEPFATLRASSRQPQPHSLAHRISSPSSPSPSLVHRIGTRPGGHRDRDRDRELPPSSPPLTARSIASSGPSSPPQTASTTSSFASASTSFTSVAPSTPAHHHHVPHRTPSPATQFLSSVAHELDFSPSRDRDVKPVRGASLNVSHTFDRDDTSRPLKRRTRFGLPMGDGEGSSVKSEPESMHATASVPAHSPRFMPASAPTPAPASGSATVPPIESAHAYATRPTSFWGLSDRDGVLDVDDPPGPTADRDEPGRNPAPRLEPPPILPQTPFHPSPSLSSAICAIAHKLGSKVNEKEGEKEKVGGRKRKRVPKPPAGRLTAGVYAKLARRTGEVEALKRKLRSARGSTTRTKMKTKTRVKARVNGSVDAMEEVEGDGEIKVQSLERELAKARAMLVEGEVVLRAVEEERRRAEEGRRVAEEERRKVQEEFAQMKAEHTRKEEEDRRLDQEHTGQTPGTDAPDRVHELERARAELEAETQRLRDELRAERAKHEHERAILRRNEPMLVPAVLDALVDISRLAAEAAVAS